MNYFPGKERVQRGRVPWPGVSKCLSELCELDSHGTHSMVSTSGTQLKVSTSEGKARLPIMTRGHKK